MTQNDPPRCADHFEACIMGEIFFGKKIFQAFFEAQLVSHHLRF